MKILAIDSSCEILSICLTDDDGTEHHPTRELVIESGLRHVSGLAPATSRLLEDAGYRPEDLDLVVCGSGPGSFTGLRISLAYAKGLTAPGKPALVLVPGLDAVAWTWSVFPGLVVPVLDARKKRFYACVYRDGERITRDLDITLEELLETIGSLCSETGESRVLATGAHADLLLSAYLTSRSGAPAEKASVTGSSPGTTVRNPGAPAARTVSFQLVLDPGYRRGTARALAVLGAERYRLHGAAAPDAGPVYLRKSEAEIGIIR